MKRGGEGQATLEQLQALRNEAVVQASSGKPCWWERVKAYDIVIDLLLAAAPAMKREDDPNLPLPEDEDGVRR